MTQAACSLSVSVTTMPLFRGLSRLPEVEQNILQSHGIGQSRASVVYYSAMCCAAFEHDSDMA